MHTATGIWFVGINTFAPAAENTVVLGSEPGEVTPDQLIGVGRVNELDPLAREIKGDFRHGLSLGQLTLDRSIGWLKSIKNG
jgi:hypothetical protein